MDMHDQVGDDPYPPDPHPEATELVFDHTYWVQMQRRVEEIRSRILGGLEELTSAPEPSAPQVPEVKVPVFDQEYWARMQRRAEEIRIRILQGLERLDDDDNAGDEDDEAFFDNVAWKGLKDLLEEAAAPFGLPPSRRGPRSHAHGYLGASGGSGKTRQLADENHWTDRELLRAAQGGWEPAMEAFCRRWYGEVYRMIVGAVGDPQLSADATIGVFLGLQQRMQRPEPIAFARSYMIASARNAAWRAVRAQRRERATTESLPAAALEVSSLAVAHEPANPEALTFLQSLLAAIAEVLSVRAADIVYLLSAGLSPAEVVATLEEVPNTDAVYRTTHRLRREWKAVVQAQDAHPQPPRWAMERWGGSLRTEAKV